MKFHSGIIIWFCLTIAPWLVASCAAGDRYQSYKVIEMKATSNDSAMLMKQYIDEQDKDIDIWAQTPFTCQVQLPSYKVQEVEEFCIKWNITMSVRIENLKDAIDKQMKQNEITARIAKNPNHRQRAQQPFDYGKYNRYEDILHELYRLQCEYPTLLDLVYVGRSYEQRPLVMVKITQNVLSDCSNDKKVVWIDGGVHGREWISIASPMYIIHELVTKFGNDRQITNLLKNNAMFIAPVVNPDGYEYTFTNDRMWRKSRTPNPGSDCVGTDPNRNWDVMWGGAGSSSDPCSNTYHGSKPESEPVVAAYGRVLRYIKKRIKAYWTLHSFSQALIFPSSYTDKRPKDFNLFIEPAFTFFLTIRRRRNYIFGNTISALRQTLTGVSIDYLHDKLGVTFSYLIELRPSGTSPIGFLLPPEQIIPASQEVFFSMLASLDRIDEISDRRKPNSFRKS